MAISLSVSQSGGKLIVFANNTGKKVAYIDHIVLTIEWSQWSSTSIFKYYDEFYFEWGRLDPGFGGSMFEIDWDSKGEAKAYAKAHYFEVDQTATSPIINIT
jgi:hypothetical protein